MSGLVGLAADAGSFLMSQLSADLQMNRQKKLLENQYSQYIKNMQAYGATPGAIVQGLGGSMSSMPAVSAPAQSPDFSQNLAARMNAQTQAQDVASMVSRRETENSFDRLKMNWQPSLWKADINKVVSETFKNYSQADLFKQQGPYFKELATNLVQKRPWELKQLEQGLINMKAQYDEIVSNVRKNKSQSNLFDSQSQYYTKLSQNEDVKHGILLDQKAIEDLRATMTKFGWDPSMKPWDNVFRWAVTDPKMFDVFVTRATGVVHDLDNIAKDTLGENYKRNALIIGGLHYMNNRIGEHYTNNLRRLNLFTGAVGNILPFASPSVESVPNPRAGTYWWEKD